MGAFQMTSYANEVQGENNMMCEMMVDHNRCTKTREVIAKGS